MSIFTPSGPPSRKSAKAKVPVAIISRSVILIDMTKAALWVLAKSWCLSPPGPTSSLRGKNGGSLNAESPM
ncbi:Uncharacterised protein [uncultured archaeon]|nr:Uncharacterised protein [uncultured archaeon]